ncbi:MAG: ABC transporter ATP-binding protein [Fimbriiglobus sp.]|nr:ABC transporter ATP-binding protein [Fimbriiglobus sp.]
MSVIETKDLRKQYGSVEALKGVTLQVEPGQIYGLLGHNGAGKSTMVKILLGIVKKTDGDAYLLGSEVGTTDIRKKVGYLPEDHQFPGYHTGVSLLHFYGELYGMSRPDRIKRMDEALDIVGLKKRAKSKIKTYSKGMKQRLGIAQAFFHDPEVIFLDEPTDGVDPAGRREIRELLQTLKGEGRTIFVNTHLLAEVEMMADRVAFIHQGELVRQGTVAEITRRANRFEIGLEKGTPFPVQEVRDAGFKVEMAEGKAEVELADGQSIDPVLEMLWANGLKLRHLVEQKLTLEDVFMKLVEGSNPGGKKGVRVARPVAARRID